jgi:hypothetical protein
MNEVQFQQGAALLAEKWTSLFPDAPFPLEFHQAASPFGSICYLLASSIPLSLLQTSGSTASHVYDISVIFNHSYRLPVLFLRGYSNTNTLLTQDKMATDFPSWQTDIFPLLAPGSVASFISPEVHPAYQTSAPWYSIHPCQTQEMMKLLGQQLDMTSDEDSLVSFLIAWLRVVGPVVGLKLPIKLG